MVLGGHSATGSGDGIARVCKGQLGMTWVKMFAKMDVVVDVNDKDVKESVCTCYEC